MMADRIQDYAEVIAGSDGKFYVHTKSENGQVILTSEGYDNEAYAHQVADDTGLPVKEANDD
jgi:uncharacterized protein YegP (UPF0339 family)